MLGKQKMTKLTHPRKMLVKKSSTMLYIAKKRDMAGKKPSVNTESRVVRYLPLLAPVQFKTSLASCFSGELEGGGHRGVRASSSSLGLKISCQKRERDRLFSNVTCFEDPGMVMVEVEMSGWQLLAFPSPQPPPGVALQYCSAPGPKKARRGRQRMSPQ